MEYEGPNRALRFWPCPHRHLHPGPLRCLPLQTLPQKLLHLELLAVSYLESFSLQDRRIQSRDHPIQSERLCVPIQPLRASFSDPTTAPFRGLRSSVLVGHPPRAPFPELLPAWPPKLRLLQYTLRAPFAGPARGFFRPLRVASQALLSLSSAQQSRHRDVDERLQRSCHSWP